jgi:hypothetical protein
MRKKRQGKARERKGQDKEEGMAGIKPFSSASRFFSPYSFGRHFSL